MCYLKNTICALVFICVTSQVAGKNPLILNLSVTTINPTCQKPNGKILAQASGGVIPYTYTLSGPYVPQASGVFIHLPPGTYDVTVTDGAGQTATQTVTLSNQFNPPSASLVSATPPTGCTSKDAVLTIAGSGGTPPYLYSLDNVNYQTSNVFSNLTAGIYGYVVKDANGCNSFTNILNNRVSINTNCPVSTFGYAASISCNPYDVSITLGTISGGTPPYQFSHDGINYQTSNTFNDLSEGVNQFWIKDAMGAVVAYSISFIDDCDPSFTVRADALAAHCGQNGTITVTATDGFPPYLYSLDGFNFQPGNVFTGLTPGVYTVTVKDAYGFISTKLATITNSCTTVMATTTNATCGMPNGKIVAQAANGLPPYQYSIDGVNFNSGNTFSNLLPGNYTVYAKDFTGGTGSVGISVPNTPGPQISSVDTKDAGCDNRSGEIYINSTGGTPPVVFSLDAVNFFANPRFTNLSSGNYIVYVKDQNGCLSSGQTTVNQNIVPPQVSFGPDVIICEPQTIWLDATNYNSTYLWQDNSTDPKFLVRTPGKYYVRVDRQGCIASDTINISYQYLPHFSLGPDKSVCLGTPLVLDPQITGVSYLWQDGTTTRTYKVTQPGIYSLAVTNNCGTLSDNIKISTAVCDIYIPNSFTPNGDGRNDEFKIGYGENITDFRLQVFNRYGQTVFDTRNKYRGWDGSFGGAKQPVDSYVYIIQYRTTTNPNWETLQGTFLLLH